VTTPMISWCSKSAGPWLNMNGPSLPTGCAAAAKPKSGADSCYPGPCPPMDTCWTRNVHGTPAACGLIPSKRRSSRKSLPGIPSRRCPARSMASPNGSVTRSCLHPWGNPGGMPPACAASCAIQSIPGLPIVARVTRCPRACANPPCDRWGRVSAIGLRPPKTGCPSLSLP